MSGRGGRALLGVVLLAACAMGVVSASGAMPRTEASGADASQPAGERSASQDATASRPGTVTIAAVGDMCFASSVRRLILRSGSKSPFSATHSVLSKADVTLGNLECALSTRGHAVPGKTFTFEGPPSAVKGLTWAGFDFVAQANNHARDFGSAALKDTIANLDRAGIKHAGAGANSASAFKPAYVTRNGAKIAYLSYSQIGPSSFRAGTHSSGTAFTLSLSKVTKAVKAANRHADYVIVAFHWGIERRSSATAAQVRFGRAAIRAGANLVLSHHPHVIEGVEFYRGGLIAYSLGNFVFSPGSAAGHDTMILTLALGPKGVRSVVARPMHIDPYGRPRPATGSTRSRILRTIAKTSRGRHTKVTLKSGLAHLAK